MDTSTLHANSGETRIDVSDGTPVTTPLLPPASRPKLGCSATTISEDVQRFKASLKWCALDHSTLAARFISYLAFLLLGVAVPTAGALFARGGTGVATYRIIQAPESALAAVAFLTLSSFHGRGHAGLRHFLILEGLRDDAPTVRQSYAEELRRALRRLVCIFLPCFAGELAHKLFIFSNLSVHVQLPFFSGRLSLSPVFSAAVLVSWVYRALVFLFVCLLFRLTCELQILRLEEFKKKMEQGIESDAWLIFLEHSRIRKQLLVTSHRYRMFIIGCLITISITQLGALMLLVNPNDHNDLFNSGDLVVCSVVQISGFFMCLMGATRITHRAHGIAAVATKWHVLITCSASNPLLSKSATLPAAAMVVQTSLSPITPTSVNSRADGNLDAKASAAGFQRREALVNYLQHNKGGITLFGFILDRRLLQALFVFEMTLVLWILRAIVI